MNLIQNTSSFSKIKPEYQKLLKVLQGKVDKRFGADLCAYYLLGSVGRGEDKLSISDMDTQIILRRSITEEDNAWAKELKYEIEPYYPMLYRLDLDFIEEKEFDNPYAKRLRFIFRTDSVLICGKDITASFSSLAPGLELAILLNRNYRQSLDNAHKYIFEPDEADRHNPKNMMVWVRWIAKKTLRLCLGIVMVDEPFYTRLMEEMAIKFYDNYPSYQPQVLKTLHQYHNPANDANEALIFLTSLSTTIYQIADDKLG
ncbi:hypothetical protein [Nostoc sp.]|uniref:hypothetical protein n=1 Tax=Nostoc sp. TaxID=1180 RepID=UPI002FF91B12